MGGNDLIADRVDSTEWYTGIGIAEGIGDLVSGFNSGSWIDATIGGFGASMEALSFVLDPLGSLVAWGVAWLMEHVKPLSDALDWLAGDPDQITAYAATWANVAKAVAATGLNLADSVRAEVASWTGAAADAYRGYAATHAQALNNIAEASSAMSTITTGAALLISLVRELVRDIIAEFVSILAVRLWEWLAEAGLTLGLASPLVVAQVSSLVAKWVAKISRLITGLIRSITNLTPIIRKLDELIDALRAVLRGLRNGPPTPSGGTPGGTPVRGPTTNTPGTPGSPDVPAPDGVTLAGGADPHVPGTLDSLDPTGSGTDSGSPGQSPDTGSHPHNHAYHSGGDPMRELGAGRDTHPAEWQALEDEARSLGVEIINRDGGIFYTPGTRRGNPGQLVIDPDASISAIRHELSHIRDDHAAGWRGFEGVYDRDFLWGSEERAYLLEVDYAREIGREDLAQELLKLMRERKEEIYGAP